MYKKHLHKLIFTFLAFLLCCFIADKSNTDSVLHCNLNLNSGVFFSYIKANDYVKTIDEQTNKPKHDIVSVINSSRVSIAEDSDFSYINYNCFYTQNSSQSLCAYIQNKSHNRVLHPPLSKLGILLI